MSADAAAFSRVLVVAPRTRVDVALPTDVALAEMMPQLLDMVGERSDDGGASHDGWHLLGTDGTELDPGRTLRSLAVLDGTALRLLPRRPLNPEPIYDDVVDVIAAAVAERTHSGDLRTVIGSVTAGAALVAGAAALWLGPHSLIGSVTAGLGALGALVAAASVARSARSRAVAVVLGSSGALLAAVAGMLALPGATGAAALLLGSVAALVYAVVAGLLVGAGALVFSAVGTIALLAAVGGLSGVLWVAPASSHATIAAVVALGALTVLPRVAVRLARLPLPMVPTTSEHLREEAAGVDFTAVRSRATVASEYLDGTSLGSIVVAGVGAALAARSGSAFSILFAVTVLGALLLRIRSTPGRGPRLALLLTACLSGALGLVGWAMGTTDLTNVLVAVVAFVLAGVAAVAAAIGPRRRTNPMAGRSLDLLESALLVAVLPLALGAINLYSIVRHL